MKRSALLALPFLFAPLTACGQPDETPQQPASTAQIQQQAQTQSSSKPAVKTPLDKDGYEEIVWEDLMPEGEEERLQEMYAIQMQELANGGGLVQEGSAADQAVQIGTFNVVDDLDGVKIKLPGYTVPFDFSPNAEITEFLLVPYYGACLHAPPPPPNQTIYVKASKPMKIGELDRAVWVRGTLKTEQQSSDLADTAYTLIMDDVTEYTY